MVTVCLRIQLELPAVDSLKEKRRILKSLITRVHNSFNVSMAEVAKNDSLRSAALGVAVVSNENSHAHQVMAKVINMIEATNSVVLAEYHTEVY